jgi:hypothetical protein
MKRRYAIMMIIGILVVMMPVIAQAKELNVSNINIVQIATDEHVGDGFCQETNVINALRVVGYFLFIAKIVIPFIIIGYGIFDLAKAVTAGDSDKVTKGVKTIGIRVLIGILVFALPSIINVILDGIADLNDDEYGYSICQTCVLDPFSCEDGEPTDIYDATDTFEDPSRTITQGSETTASTSTSFVENNSTTHDAGNNGTTTTTSTSFVENNSTTHDAGNNATTSKNTTKIFIQVE